MKCRVMICAALQRKYILERPKEYLAAFVREHGTAGGERMWLAFQAKHGVVAAVRNSRPFSG